MFESLSVRDEGPALNRERRPDTRVPSVSVPASAAVEASAADYEQDDEDDKKCIGIHDSYPF